MEDTGIAQGDITAGERDALRFATRVLTVADRMGVAHDEVFVTGHSLGGIQAEYVAQQTGLAGIAFESAGLPRSDTTVGTGRNFVNVVQYGDPVASYASDIAGEQPFAPGSFGRGPGALPHYGYVAMIGNPDAQQGLAEAAALSSLGPIGLGLTTALYGVGLAAYHVPNVQAYSLGVELTQYGASEVVGDRSGPVLDAADFTIRDLIEATDASYLRPRGEDPNVSPTEGRHAGDLAELLDSGERFAKATHFNDVAALVNALVSTEGGVNAEDVSFANTFVGQAFAGVESDVAGTLSRLLDDLLEGLGAAPVGTASLTDIGHLCPV